MKYRMVFFVLMFSALLLTPIFAHPPKGIDLAFESNTKILKVNIPHVVDNPSRHYIEKVVVELNGEEIITQIFTMQTDKKTQDIMYVIVDAQEGDKIAVTAYCNIAGKRTKTLDVVVQKEMEVEEEQ